jgi:type IV secretion system protein VirB10
MKQAIWFGVIVFILVGSCLPQTVIDESKLIRPAPVQPVPAPTVPQAVYTIPAGTTILARLTSPLHTTSATAGSGIYMTTEFPIVVSDRVVVPAKSSLLGTIEHDQRPGRVSGRAQFRFQLHTLILPNNHTVAIAGILQGVPGSSLNRRVDRRGTTEPVDQIDRDVHTMVRSTLLGASGGAIFGRNPAAVAIGTGAGAAAGLAKVLFTRGDEIYLPAGTTVEMVLERPATVEAQYVP